MNIEKPNFRYLLNRLDEVRTQSDLNIVKDEIESFLPLDQFEDEKGFDVSEDEKGFDVSVAIEDVKRDYIERALVKTSTLYEAADLLGLKSYQVLVNWMKKLGVSK